MSDAPDHEGYSLHEVLEWVQAQAEYLHSPSARFVLWYLALNAFRHENNPEGGLVGQVMTGRANIAKIQSATGYSDKTVREALHQLQDAGYIIAEMSRGRGKSRIFVYWTPLADEMRSNFRRGIKPLLKGFERTITTNKKPEKGLLLAFPADKVNR
jgi:DNA-binding transcriptional ArsR family regulator